MPSWVSIGPTLINDGGLRAIGRIHSIAVHPTAPTTLWVGGPRCGIWKTTDGGASWAPVGDSLPTLSVAALAVDPVTPTRVYAVMAGIGVFRSEDGGETWTQIAADQGTPAGFGVLLIDPTDSSILYLTGTNGLFRSTDSGLGWTRVKTGAVDDAVMDPSSPAIIYAAVQGDGIYKTTTGGAAGDLAWTKLSGLPSSGFTRVTLALCAAVPTALYAGLSGDPFRLYGSTDGATFALRYTAPSSIYNPWLGVDPVNPEIVYLPSAIFQRSTDGGASFVVTSGDSHECQKLVTDPVIPGVIYLGRDSGLFRSADQGVTFAQIGGGIANVEFYDGALAATDARLMIGGTQDNGTLKYDGTSTVWKLIQGGDGGTVDIDPTNAEILYAMYQYADSITRSDDGGRTFLPFAAGLPTPWQCPNLQFLVHPTTPATLIACCTSLWRITSPTGTWTTIFTPDNDNVVRAAVDPSVDLYYAGTSSGKLHAGPSGASWQEVFKHEYGHGFSDLRVDPHDPTVVYATFGGDGAKRVYRLTRSSPAPSSMAEVDITAWLPVGLNVQTIAVDRMAPFTVYVGTNRGVYRGVSTDGGASWSWSSYNNGLPLADVRSLDVHPQSGVMRATTFGRSAYEIYTEGCFLVIDRSTFGQDEVLAMLTPPNVPIVADAFWVIVEGFTAQELGLNPGNLGNPPAVPAITFSPALTGMSAQFTGPVVPEDPSLPPSPQRFRYAFQVSFASDADFGFTGDFEDVMLTATFTSTGTTVSNSGLIRLIKAANPFLLDGPVSWLSIDLRVFRVNPGVTRFGVTMGAGPADADAPAFIQSVMQALTTGSGSAGGESFEADLPNDIDASSLELTPTDSGGNAVFNFALARVRMRGLRTDAQNARVFFRLFRAQTTNVPFDINTTYRRFSDGAPGGHTIPLLGINGGEYVTIPCFATARIDTSAASMTTQSDLPNVQTIVQDPLGAEVQAFYGCWLDINQPGQLVVPGTVPGSNQDGPFSGTLLSVQQAIVRSPHQCLVAEIAFDPAPVPAGADPSTTDKLAQRNLAFVSIPNPGLDGSRRVPQTFEVRPTPAAQLQTQFAGRRFDELMIDWGPLPAGSTAQIYLPALSSDPVLNHAASLYTTRGLQRVNANTLSCRAEAVTYVPLPSGANVDSAGLLTLDLPPTVRRDQAFTIIVRQVTNAAGEPPIIVELRARGVAGEEAGAAEEIQWRKVLGTFQLTTPVRTKEVLLEPEVRLLSVLRWIQQSISENDRWYPVFRSYVEQTAGRVDGLGGFSGDVLPSPFGEDFTLRLRILDAQGGFFGKPVDIDIKHRTLESEPRKRFRRVVPTNVFLVKDLRRFPQSDYIVTITPSEWFDPESQFVTIPASGIAELVFVMSSRGDDGGGVPPTNDVTLRLKIVDPQGRFFDEPVDIDIKHRTLESEPRKEFRHVVASDLIEVKGLRRFPQSDYVVTVTPSERFRPKSQFVTIPASGFATMEFVLHK